MIKIDLHTHSSASHDGGITAEEYMHVLENGQLDYIAITDHDTISMARKLQQSIGSKIIIGEEISTLQGDLVGLFLYQAVKPGMTALETAQAISSQGGLVYVPHPFETLRKGLTQDVLDAIRDEVHIVEVHNGRAVFQNKGSEAFLWTRLHNKVGAASSDAHGLKGLGTTYSQIRKAPTADNLLEQLSKAHYSVRRPPLTSLLYPKYHTLRHKFRGKK